MKISAKTIIPCITENLDTFERLKAPLWHPLGFVSCVLESDESTREVRINYWPQEERRTKNPDWPIHTHRYFLSSFVLAGTVRDIQYRSYSGKGHKIYEVNYIGSNSEINKSVHSVDIKEVSNIVRNAGDVYSVQRGTLHRTFVEQSKSAMTIVVLSDFTDENPIVIGQEGGNNYPYERIPYDSCRFWQEVRLNIEPWANF